MTMPEADVEIGSPFDRMVCAIDGSLESLEGAYQGSRLAPNRPTTLVYVVDTLDAPMRAADYPGWMHATREAAAAMLAAARRDLAALGVETGVDVAVEEGDVPEALRYAAAGRSVLLTLGSGEETELLEPSTLPPPTGVRLTHRVLETVTSSVLVARSRPDPEHFPSSITVGVDGSPASIYAYEVAAALAQRSGAELTVLTALGGKGPDLQALHDSIPHIPVDRIESSHPVTALLGAASDSDLIVVGNRGRHGLRAIGSVSARVVAHSPTSVLVARQT